MVDWHAGMLAGGGAMERLRAAEKSAKEKRACLYAAATTQPTKANGSMPAGISRSFDAIVVRVWSGDQISVVDKDGGKERRLQLSSTRAPKLGVKLIRFSYLTDNSTDSRTLSKLSTRKKLGNCYGKSLLANR